MQIKKDGLLTALEMVKPGLANKEIIEQTTSFAFVDGRVVTYNDEISLSHPVEGLDLTGAVQAENLYKFLARIKRDELDVVKEDSQIIIKSGRAKAGLVIHAEIKLPLDSEITDKSDWQELPEGFNDAVKFATGSCSTDMTNPILTCVHINEAGIIEGSDNYRISHYKIDEMPVKTFLLPGSSALEVIKIKPTHVAEGTGWVHFKNEFDTIISCRILEEDEYVNTSKVIRVKGTRLILPDTTGEVLERAMVFAKRDRALDESVSITIENRRLVMEAEADNSWFEEKINMKYTGDPIKFGITPHLLQSILNETRECFIDDNAVKLKFQGEGWMYITMLRS